MSESSKWDFESLRAHKQGVMYQMQCDIDRLDMAIGLLKEVNETFAEAFFNTLDHTDYQPSTGTTAGTVPMKLSRAISDIKGIKGALEDRKEKV